MKSSIKSIKTVRSYHEGFHILWPSYFVKEVLEEVINSVAEKDSFHRFRFQVNELAWWDYRCSFWLQSPPPVVFPVSMQSRHHLKWYKRLLLSKDAVELNFVNWINYDTESATEEKSLIRSPHLRSVRQGINDFSNIKHPLPQIYPNRQQHLSFEQIFSWQ